MPQRTRSRLGYVLAGVFAFAMIMAVGPGVLLVSRPIMVLGLPLLHVWAIAWYFVIVAVAMVAYFCIWRYEDAGDGDE